MMSLPNVLIIGKNPFSGKSGFNSGENSHIYSIISLEIQFM